MPDRLDSLTILVVEDEPLIALDIEDMLVALGASVRLVDSIAQARLALLDKRPDLAILDVVLPDGQTFALAAELAVINVDLIFLTGYGHGVPESLAHIALIGKPYGPNDIADAVLRVIARRNEPTGA